MTLEQIMLMVIAGFSAWVFWRQLAIRELALRYALAACEKSDVQLLDQSIGLNGLKITKLAGGGIGLLRDYGFEFTSTGEQRYAGKILMIGKTLQGTKLEAFRESGPSL